MASGCPPRRDRDATRAREHQRAGDQRAQQGQHRGVKARIGGRLREGCRGVIGVLGGEPYRDVHGAAMVW